MAPPRPQLGRTKRRARAYSEALAAAPSAKRGGRLNPKATHVNLCVGPKRHYNPPRPSLDLRNHAQMLSPIIVGTRARTIGAGAKPPHTGLAATPGLPKLACARAPRPSPLAYSELTCALGRSTKSSTTMGAWQDRQTIGPRQTQASLRTCRRVAPAYPCNAR